MQMFRKIKEVLTGDKANHVAHKVEKSSHFIYLGAAAFGAHEVYSVAAGVIVVIMVIGLFLHWNLEG